MNSDSFRRCIVAVPPDDHRLTALAGSEIPGHECVYRLGRPLGTGSMATTFVATRSAVDGELPAIVKVTLPAVMTAAGATAALAIRKEAVALGRLSSVAIPSPFVVRLLEVGEVELEGAAGTTLPWIALEHVHGGAEGATLAARVEHAIDTTGHGFDPTRVERAVRALTSGLAAIHALKIIHRDLAPENVLCCGRGDDEIPKIAEFGFARAVGMKETFGRTKLGTPGYAAPELSGSDPAKVGPWTDVYALAAVVYHLLTGREHGVVVDPLAAFRGDLRTQQRPTLLEANTLHPELRARPDVCHALDRVIAEATSQTPERRPASAEALAWRLLGALRVDAPVRRARTTSPSPSFGSAPPLDAHRWSMIARPRAELVVRSVAWSGDGRALAVTDRGLAFWDGTRWTELDRGASSHRPRFVRALTAGQWLVARDGAPLARFDLAKLVDVLDAPEPSLHAEHASGDLDDLAAFVFVGSGAPQLHALSAGRWLDPLPLAGVDVVTALARTGDARWLVAGRASDGGGWLGSYEPLRLRVERLPTAPSPTFLDVAGLDDRDLGVACGLGGALAWVSRGALVATPPLAEPLPLAKASLDAHGCAWLASNGAIFRGEPGLALQRAWSDARFRLPFASIHAADGRVLAMTVDGGIVEARVG